MSNVMRNGGHGIILACMLTGTVGAQEKTQGEVEKIINAGKCIMGAKNAGMAHNCALKHLESPFREQYIRNESGKLVFELIIKFPNNVKLQSLSKQLIDEVTLEYIKLAESGFDQVDYSYLKSFLLERANILLNDGNTPEGI